MKKNLFTFLLMVVIPTILAVFYYVTIASKQYQAETSFIVQGDDSGEGSIIFGSLAALGGGGATSTAKDSYAIHEYIKSGNFIDSIQDEFDIRQAFTNKNIDWYSRLPVDANRQDLLEFWQDKLDIEYDSDSGITKMEVTAFQPEDTLKIISLITRESEKLVNQLSDRSKKDRLSFSNTELTRAENELAAIRKKLRNLRNTKEVVSPEIAIKSQIGIITELQTDLAKKEAELNGIQGYLKPSSIKIKSLKSEIRALKTQIKKLRSTMANKSNDGAISNILGDYQEILVRQEFAEKRYQSALIDLESARVDASKKQRYLDVIVEPTLPDASFYPDLSVQLPNVLLFSLLFWVLGRLIIGLIRDHAGWV